jgi:hypothetical protein
VSLTLVIQPGPAAGPQFGAQGLAYQRLVAEGGPLLIECHQKQAGCVDVAQQHRCVLPPGDRRARFRGQLLQDGHVEHEPGHLGRLPVEDLRDEVLGDRMAVGIYGPRDPCRIPSTAQRQRRHLQRRRPPLGALMQQGKLGRADADAEVRQQVPALGQGQN